MLMLRPLFIWLIRILSHSYSYIIHISSPSFIYRVPYSGSCIYRFPFSYGSFVYPITHLHTRFITTFEFSVTRSHMESHSRISLTYRVPYSYGSFVYQLTPVHTKLLTTSEFSVTHSHMESHIHTTFIYRVPYSYSSFV